MRTRTVINIFFWAVALLCAACGYELSPGIRPAAEARTLFVPVLENNTTEPGLGVLVADDMIRWLGRNRQFGLSGSPGADFVLKGKVLALYETSSSRRYEGGSTSKRLRMSLSLALINKEGHTVWSDGGVSDFEDYAVVEGSLQATQANRNAALSALSARMAEKARDRIEASFARY